MSSKKEISSSEEVVYYGQRKCEGKFKDGKSCTNGAYYREKKSYLCGVHSSKLKRKVLPKIPPKLKEMAKVAEREAVEEARVNNQKQGKRGDVIATRLFMRKPVQRKPGYFAVFPNLKDHAREGFVCKSLSPMVLGPVEHGQPDLPPSLNIENFHQGSKCFQEELGPDGKPSNLFYKNRLSFYKDPEPHRHKYKNAAEVNSNIPKFFVWTDRDGTEHHLSYVQSRQFYCNFYERLASVQPDFQRLQTLVKEGTNIQIFGFDVKKPISPTTIESAYLDPSAPFGHELVLYTLLVVEDENDYPWRKHKTFTF